MKKMARVFSWFVVGVCVVVSAASQASAPVSRESLLEALLSGNLSQLERTFNEVQQGFERNRRADKNLAEVYYGLEDMHLFPDQATVSKRLDDWVRRFPRSYAAKTVRGSYLADKAMQARGGKFVSATTDEQFAEMRKWHVLAQRDLQASLTLTRYPLISHIRLYTIAMVGSDDQAKAVHFSKAFEIAPASMQLHKQVMVSLTPRWGGSYEAMQAYIDKVKPGLESDKDRGVLKSMIIEDKASSLTAQKQYEQAYGLYGEVIPLRDSSNNLCKRAYLGSLLKKPAVSILNDLKAASAKDMPDTYCATMAASFARANVGLADTIPLMDAYIKHFPRNADLYNARAWAYQQRGDKPSAYPDLLKSAELGNAWGQTMAGKYLFSGWGGPVDQAKAIELLKAAAEQGEPNAQLSVVQALEYLGKPDEAKQAKQRYSSMKKAGN